MSQSDRIPCAVQDCPCGLDPQLSAEHWNALANAEDRGAQIEYARDPRSSVSVYVARAKTYREVALALAMGREIGEPYCSTHFGPRAACRALHDLKQK